MRCNFRRDIRLGVPFPQQVSAGYPDRIDPSLVVAASRTHPSSPPYRSNPSRFHRIGVCGMSPSNMAIRFRIRTDGGGEYLADHVDRLGHRRASRFESREAAEAFLKRVQKVELSRKASTPSVEPELVEDAA